MRDFSSIFDLVIKGFIFMLFSYGLWLLLGKNISNLIEHISRKNSALKKVRAANKPKSNILIKHLTKVLSVVLTKNIVHEAHLFIGGTIVMFLLSFIMIARLEGVFRGVILSAFISLLPYLLLQGKLRNIRINSSYEGNELVTTIINNYKQNNFNIIEAVDRSACSDKLSFFTRNNLLRLSVALKSYKDENDLDDAVNAFVFAYNTEWSILLGMNIKIAAFDGTNVSVSMEDIVDELKNTGEALEVNKRYNNESFTMIRFMLIPFYLFTVYISITGFGFTLKKFVQYQFFTDLGLSFAVLTYSVIALCFLVYSFVRRPKYDI